MTPIVPVILCGGSGSRLWPLSRAGFPKQFLCLTGRDSLFQQTAQRLTALAGDEVTLENTLVVTSEEHRFLASEQWRESQTGPVTLLLEPAARNTAPALTLAALAAMAQGQDPVLVVSPADQVMGQVDAFVRVARQAVRVAADGAIVIFGVPPHRPETGYGYIQGQSDAPMTGVHRVQRFVEKPDLSTAQTYLADGSYFWNAGIFVLRASAWLKALSELRPDVFEATQAAWAMRSQDRSFVRPDQSLFSAVPSESIDYAVMEQCPQRGMDLRMIELDAGWSDLGAWDAVWGSLPKDPDGNARVGDTMAIESQNNLVHASHRLVCAVGVSDLMIVETADAVLVAAKAHSQRVKDLVGQLQAQGRIEGELHRKVHRPWGWYLEVDEGERFKVKRISVKPGASLSLQMHHHRAEHWVVVKGTALITNGDETLTLTENQSTYIPLGQKHRLSNPGELPLELIEVQSGGYLGEDDIVRFEDHYGRLPS
jgi:mannose-1-phosphate guanylyltransferase/mannose-6-phosphate isomerase